jgi:hypothetical protein
VRDLDAHRQANPTYRTLQTLAAALGGKIELVIG